MGFFISNAYAEGAAAAPAPGEALMGFLPLVFIFVIFYFFLIRPQMKRAKEHKKLVESISKGDEVMTAGGIIGKVTDVNDNFVSVDIADGVVVKVQRQSVTSLLPKGTVKSS